MVINAVFVTSHKDGGSLFQCNCGQLQDQVCCQTILVLLSNIFLWSLLVCHGLEARKRAVPVFGRVDERRRFEKVKVCAVLAWKLTKVQSCPRRRDISARRGLRTRRRGTVMPLRGYLFKTMSQSSYV